MGGIADLEARVLRHTSERFGEDPLRVLRGMQLVARFELDAAPETLRLCATLSPQGLPAERLFEEAQRRVGTGELNRVLEKATEARGPNSGGARAKVLYATQTDSAPPSFVLFVNDKRPFTKAYVRYLENRLREGLDFKEVPLRIVLRDRKRDGPESS